ncbi:MAG: hypothetical protein ACRD0N_09735 [Acidimicrobiales bacterium]
MHEYRVVQASMELGPEVFARELGQAEAGGFELYGLVSCGVVALAVFRRPAMPAPA